MKNYKSVLRIVACGVAFLVINVALQRHFFRIDLTSEKRYSISENTKNLMRNLHQPLTLNIYLDGDLNSGFLRLRNALRELLDEFNVYAAADFEYNFINPSKAGNSDERNRAYVTLAERGLTPTTIYEHDAEGKSIQKIVFPWVEIVTKKDTFPVNLLKNIQGNSGAENLNISIENLEFELTDAIRILNNREIKKIAFIEGHGELTEDYVYDASVAFSRYFQVDRGVLGADVEVLNDYKAIIIANPQTPFSESDKYIIDQYVMNGGRVLWFVDGVTFSFDELTSQGVSPIVDKNLNLSDMLFRYGVRINPVLLQDVQCLRMPVNVSGSATPQYESMPWYYAPLLLPNPNNSITRNLTQVNANFCSSIDLMSIDSTLKQEVLLVSSTATHQQTIPSMVDISQMPDETDENYFSTSYVPVAVLLDGRFRSVFANRLLPEGINAVASTKNVSEPTRMIVVADGDIIGNDVVNTGNGFQVLPMGFDRYSGVQFGNKDFVLNALLYLTDEGNWFDLRNRNFKVRMLNKSKVSSNYLYLKWLNVALPIIILLLCGGGYLLSRFFKYRK